MTDEVTLGLPAPWRMKRHLIRGDRYFFFAVSERTFAIGFEFLMDGFVAFIGPMIIGWASISKFREREASRATEAR